METPKASTSLSPKQEDHDPLDIMSVMLSSPEVKPSAKGRTLRPRQTLSSASEEKKRPRREVKRVRTVSSLGEENLEQPAKKIKLEKNKAVGVLISAKKLAIEASRRTFFRRHRSIFEPLLPSNSKFFEKLANEGQTSIYHPKCELEDQPSLIQGGQMKDYQLQGLSFLIWMHENGMNSILGDEMGLGKTLQTLALFAHIKEAEKVVPEPHLVMCPLSVLSSWMAESARWLPSFKVIKFHGSQDERARLKDELRTQKFDILVTTYEAYVSEDSWFKTRRWTYCVLDEGHRIKTSTTNLSHKVQGLGAQHRLILTGTPLQNNLIELWGLLHWLYPTLFTQTTEHGFQEAFDLTLGKYDSTFLNAVQKLLELIMLRRTKKTVDFTLPPLEEMVVFLPLTEAQRFWYMRLLKRLDTISLDEIFTCTSAEDDGRKEAQALIAKAMTQNTGSKTKRYQQLMNLLMQLRRICDHPYTLEGGLPEPYHIGEHIVATSSKLQFLDKLLRELLPKGERVLIFSQWTGMLDMVQDFLFLRDITHARLDGSVPRARRALDIRLFQQEKSPYQVFLISTQAGGLGINLTKASHVVLVDSHWNPQVDLQALARAHRIGQQKTVKVYRLICQNSVEDQMLSRLRKKLFLSVKVMSSDSNQGEMDPALKTNELMRILYRGTSALARWDTGTTDKGLSAFLSASLEEILERSKRQEDIRDFKIKREVGEAMEDEKLAIDLEEEERKLLSGVTQVQTRLFEGQHHGKDNKQLAQEWTALQKRARVDRLIIVNGIESIPDSGPVIVTANKPQPPKRKRATWEHEDYCLHCRDGGDLLCCQHCPRVFHPRCVGLPKTAKKLPMVSCPQHACAACGRKSGDAGGMLFRCRTCSAAHCEDCLPSGDIAAIGPTIPEFLLLGLGEVTQAFWVHCEDCVERFETEPWWKASWEEEDERLKDRIEKMRTRALKNEEMDVDML